MCYDTIIDKKQDYALETLLELDGYIAEIGDGYWVKIEVRRVAQGEEKPHGIKYSLTLHNASGERLLGYDNAHGLLYNLSAKAYDHMHKGGKIVKDNYRDAAKFLEDFWKDVDRIIDRKS